MKPVIFAVEDDDSLQELYLYSLEKDFDCTCFADSESLHTALAEKIPDLILLDVMLPGDSGFAILSRLKSDKRYEGIPVIMVSAKGEEISKVKGLNMGADDYIAKPFGVLELVARIKANLRKMSKAKSAKSDKNAQIITHRDISIDCTKHKITINGKVVHLTLKEHNLLVLLCENAEKIQRREHIFATVWGNDFFGETRTLDIHIKELRKKLADADSMASIQTIRGVGYMLI
jgi:two-component system alkaline phosphatase synthesis response regulator PhoP